MSFQEDIKGFVKSVLIGAGPLIIFTEFFIDQLRQLFLIETRTAFILFSIIYFLGSIITTLIWLFFYASARREENSKRDRIELWIIFWLFLPTSFYTIFVEGIHFTIIILILSIGIGAYLIIKTIRLSSGIRKNFRPLYLEILTSLLLPVLCSVFYITNIVNRTEAIYDNEKTIVFSEDSTVTDILTAYDTLSTEKYISKKDPVIIGYQKILNYSHFQGILVLSCLFLIYLSFYFHYRVKESLERVSEADYIIETKIEPYRVVETKKKSSIHANFFKYQILIVALLVIPIFSPPDEKGTDPKTPFIGVLNRVPQLNRQERLRETFISDSILKSVILLIPTETQYTIDGDLDNDNKPEERTLEENNLSYNIISETEFNRYLSKNKDFETIKENTEGLKKALKMFYLSFAPPDTDIDKHLEFDTSKKDSIKIILKNEH